MKKINEQTIKTLENAYSKFHKKGFIEDDPILIPHQFTKLQDIEIMAFFSATLAWGQRKTIINSCKKLVDLFHNEPYNFIMHHNDKDLKTLLSFKHRTFNATDLLYFVAFLRNHYEKNTSLESAFTINFSSKEPHVGKALEHFHNYFTSLEFFPSRTRKHVATPARNSACKRLNMFLRWMVRKDSEGIDFGLWESIQPSQLLCPLDVHVERQARKLGLLKRKQRDFKAVLELSENLKKIDALDPVRFDFALFTLGIEEKVK